MQTQIFCRKHYRRSVPYVPMLVPTMSIEQIGCIIHYREDLVYKMKCPVCWNNGEREKVFAEFKKRRQEDEQR